MLEHAELPEAPWLDEVFATRLARPTIPGTIKQQLEDFCVFEALALEPIGEGEHVYLQVTKKGANTAWVAEQIAAFAGVRALDVGYAGRKDRHAIARQWFSVYLPGTDCNWSDLEIEGVCLEQVCRHTRKLRPGEISENRFEIVVRHRMLAAAEKRDLETRLQAIQLNGFPNFFGRQRFGRDLHNIENADRLLRFGERVRGDKGMILSAARAWLFNRFLSRQIETGGGAIVGPLYGKSRDPQAGEEELGAVYEAWVEGLRRRGAKVGERALFVVPHELVWNQADDSTRLSFGLPAGSFATSLLAEIFVVEDAAS
ncbi:MAG: tRNA pseudouridine(13) synthase TruD [Gammaproteobacteria bacterium]|jgi:tRNA pseudouridine13 synthase|nr:tRNA pseudouridine(13) synthase TruD [Gammaproteobacteria bacterium]MBT4492726.1 tRNA pseudouridine(13) synthase TruD [Gammaproteobacteria bacterium]MBT7370829.1 tRNA pseudouridine(13) synthase TruD [Gammaproteobacteria bacterium]